MDHPSNSSDPSSFKHQNSSFLPSGDFAKEETPVHSSSASQDPEFVDSLREEISSEKKKEASQSMIRDQSDESIKAVIQEGSALQEFCNKLSSFSTPEEKIAYGLEFMRQSISQEGSPRFREFWEGRRQILPFFKENLNPVIRSKLWDEYVGLTVEARRLKEVLEEHSAFAMEQIDLAVQSIQKDLENLDSLLEKTEPISCPERCETISPRMAVYDGLQRELNLLNTLASHLNALRKEVLKTDMRIRFKTKFFKRLSELGDRVFPRRKELIESVSAEFVKDVTRFVERHFQGESIVGAPYYALRGEIKALQAVAKVLTLNSSSFNITRLKLSECWDKVRILEKEHKQEMADKKQASSEQRQQIDQLIEALRLKSAEMSLRALDAEIELIQKEMRKVVLHRDDVRELRDQLSQLRAPHLAEQAKRTQELEEAEKEAIRIKREKVSQLKDAISLLIKEGQELTLEAFSLRYDEILKTIGSLEIAKIEKQQLDRSLRPLKDFLVEKKEQSLLNLSEDDRKVLENLRLILQQKKERRQEIKETLQTYRKSLGGSNLDFEKAMQLRELIDQEKEFLEKANEGIVEIENRISEMEA